MITIAIANQKGGVGKTTTAVTLAHGLALKSFNVLLVDLDPQGQCASALGMDHDDGVFRLLAMDAPLRDVVRSTRRPGLWLLPGDKRTKTAEGIMVLERKEVDTLATVLHQNINGGLHYIVIDTAPSVGGLQENALYAADMLIIPSAVDHLALEGIASVIQTLRAVRRTNLPPMRILPTFFDDTTRESKTNLEHLQRHFGDLVLPPIHRATMLRECPALGQTIFEYQPKSRPAEEYARLVWEVINVSTA